MEPEGLYLGLKRIAISSVGGPVKLLVSSLQRWSDLNRPCIGFGPIVVMLECKLTGSAMIGPGVCVKSYNFSQDYRAQPLSQPPRDHSLPTPIKMEHMKALPPS